MAVAAAALNGAQDVGVPKARGTSPKAGCHVGRPCRPQTRTWLAGVGSVTKEMSSFGCLFPGLGVGGHPNKAVFELSP